MKNSASDLRSGEQKEVEFRSLDGLHLTGTLVVPAEAPGEGVAVLVHGGGVTRDEGGFYIRLAARLAESGIGSLRFDFRAHGGSEGRQEDLTLSGVANDIRAAVRQALRWTGSNTVNLVGASFSGGITALYASRFPGHVRTLVLLNPLLDYKKRFIEDKPYWEDDRIDAHAGRRLTEKGFIAHSPSFKLGRPLLNEIFYLQPDRELAGVSAPTLIVHGTGDTFIPVDSSRHHAAKMGGETRLLEIEGAQHGFAVHDDPEYRDPQSREWQSFVIQSVDDWMLRKP